MTKSSSTPKPAPFAVKPVPVWHSTDRQFLGYFPGIFGTTDRFQTYGYLRPAFSGPTPIDGAPGAHLFATEEACMAAWKAAAPLDLTGGLGFTLAMCDEVNQQKLYRDPNATAVLEGAA